MKKINLNYWLFTGPFSLLMVASALSGLNLSESAIAGFAQLGYPAYLLPFLSVAKILGVIAILIPGYTRIKEWAYAGLVIDLTGATYSMNSQGTPVSSLSIMIIPFALAIGSYFFYLRKQKFSGLTYSG